MSIGFGDPWTLLGAIGAPLLSYFVDSGTNDRLNAENRERLEEAMGLLRGQIPGIRQYGRSAAQVYAGLPDLGQLLNPYINEIRGFQTPQVGIPDIGLGQYQFDSQLGDIGGRLGGELARMGDFGLGDEINRAGLTLSGQGVIDSPFTGELGQLGDIAQGYFPDTDEWVSAQRSQRLGGLAQASGEAQRQANQQAIARSGGDLEAAQSQQAANEFQFGRSRGRQANEFEAGLQGAALNVDQQQGMARANLLGQEAGLRSGLAQSQAGMDLNRAIEQARLQSGLAQSRAGLLQQNAFGGAGMAMDALAGSEANQLTNIGQLLQGALGQAGLGLQTEQFNAGTAVSDAERQFQAGLLGGSSQYEDALTRLQGTLQAELVSQGISTDLASQMANMLAGYQESYVPFSNTTSSIMNAILGLGSMPEAPEQDNTGAYVGAGTSLIGLLALLSDRDAKHSVSSVDPDDVLRRATHVPVHRWQYNDPSFGTGEHIGPMAQDFHAAFGTGTRKNIHIADAFGVALASIQALTARVASLEKQLEAKT